MATPQQQPPPMMAVPQPPQAYMAAPSMKKPMSIWWPMGLLIAWVVLSAVGGGLIGAAASMTDYYCSSVDDSCYYTNDGEGMFWGGVAMLVIAGLCGITFWVLLILYLVKRSRSRHPGVVYANNLQPAAGGYYPYAYPGGLAPQQQYAPQQQQYAMQHSSMVPAAKQEGKACAACGTVAATPFCPQCGGQIQ